jgi:hypothetical protein
MNFKSKAVLALAALLTVAGADAATRYVDRFVPESVCLIDWRGHTFNANLISEITVGLHRAVVPRAPSRWDLIIPFFLADEVRDVLLIRVQLVTSRYYQFSISSMDEGQKLKAELVGLVDRKCGRNSVPAPTVVRPQARPLS